MPTHVPADVAAQRRARGRHRKPRQNQIQRTVGTAVVAGATVAVPLTVAFASPASAASTRTWDRLAQCESGGRWHINTGNGYYGGLQFSAPTWRAYGGAAHAPRADLASKASQIRIAERVLDGQGWGAWPACSRKLGLTRAHAGGTPDVLSGAPSARKSKAEDSKKSKRIEREKAAKKSQKAKKHSQHRGKAKVYTVRPGDTLATIADRFNLPWQELYRENRGTIGSNPNLIYPGQKLHI
jgi:hypothetical protein